MVPRERLLAVSLALIMVTAAGCAGWGTDDPATTGNQQENDTEDLNDAANGAENESTNASANSSGNQSNATASDSSDESTSERDQSSSDAESDAQSDPQQSNEGDASDRDSTDRTQDGDTGAHDDTSDTGDGTDSTDDMSTADGDQKSDKKDQQSDGDKKSDGKEHNEKPETYTLTATVLSPDGEPVEGMDVSLSTYDEGEDVATATTDVNGQVTFDVEQGDYELVPHVSESAHTDYGTHLVDVSEDTEYTIQLVSPPGDEGDGADDSDDTDEQKNDSNDSDDGEGEDKNNGNEKDRVTETERTLTVTVVDENGEPIEGASVHATGPVLSNGVAHEPAGKTNANGVAKLTAYDGEYGVEAQYDGTTTEEKTVVVDGDTEVTVTIDTSPDEDPGEETHTLTVTVTDPNGEPVTGETVHVVTYSGGADVASKETDENGTAQFQLENGDYELGVSALDRGLLQPSDQRLVSINSEDEEFTIELQYSGNEPPDTATGIVRVVDDEGNPIEGERVTLTPPGTMKKSEKKQRVTDENGEVRIELAAGEPDDVVTYGVEVRGEEKQLGIMSDAHHGVQEVEFNPTHRFYQFKTVLQVVDENDEPIAGEPVETRHGLVDDEWEVVGETDEHGEIVLTGGSSEPTDVDAREVRVRDQTITTFLEYERQVETMQIETDETSGTTNETMTDPTSDR